MRRFGIALAIALACAACNPTTLKQGYCRSNADCPSNICHKDTWTCEPLDGSTESVDSRDASDAGDAEVRFNCHTANDMCPADAGVCDPDGGTCVECTTDDNCSAKDVKTPICRAQMCRACQTDDECPGPKICLPDGHCAAIGEVLFVEFNSSVCPNTTGMGTPTNPYCAPNDAVSKLSSTQDVIVIRGPTADRMSIATGLSAVVIGRDGAGGPASIPASAAAAIQVTSGDLVIRDLSITGGSTAPTTKGIIITGAAAKVTLRNVTVNLTAGGLGIQADNGATLTTEHCTVTNNNKGGIRLDAAQFLIKNTKVTGNGPGDDSGTGWGGLRITNVVTNSALELLTVTNNTNVGISCSAGVISSGVLVSDNTGGLQVTNSCSIMPCSLDAGTTTCGAQF